MSNLIYFTVSYDNTCDELPSDNIHLTAYKLSKDLDLLRKDIVKDICQPDNNNLYLPYTLTCDIYSMNLITGEIKLVDSYDRETHMEEYEKHFG